MGLLRSGQAQFLSALSRRLFRRGHHPNSFGIQEFLCRLPYLKIGIKNSLRGESLCKLVLSPFPTKVRESNYYSRAGQLR